MQRRNASEQKRIGKKTIRNPQALTMDFECEVQGERSRFVYGQAGVVSGVMFCHLKELEISSSSAEVEVGVVLIQRHVILK